MTQKWGSILNVNLMSISVLSNSKRMSKYESEPCYVSCRSTNFPFLQPSQHVLMLNSYTPILETRIITSNENVVISVAMTVRDNRGANYQIRDYDVTNENRKEMFLEEEIITSTGPRVSTGV